MLDKIEIKSENGHPVSVKVNEHEFNALRSIRFEWESGHLAIATIEFCAGVIDIDTKAMTALAAMYLAGQGKKK